MQVADGTAPDITPASQLSIEVIIPVRNMAEHIAACVSSLAPQLGVGDRITVVDDASTDETADAARRAGARVVVLEQPRGPYRARQLAANRSDAPLLLFIDARSRALPGLMEAHRRLLQSQGTVLSCTNVKILGGESFSSRIAANSGLFDVESKVGVPGQRDFFPTCNLGVRRDAFVHVGGFRDMRSGGDIDLCWRIQVAHLGGMGANPNVFMQWIPRDAFRDLVEQAYRYGKSGAVLSYLYRDQSPDGPAKIAESPRKRSAWRYAHKITTDSLRNPSMISVRASGRVLALIQAFGRWRNTRFGTIRVPLAILTDETQ